MEFNEDGSLKVSIRKIKEESVEKKVKHKWDEEDHLITFFLSRYGNNSLGFTLSEISKKRGMSESSLKIQISAYKQIIGKSSFGQPTGLLYQTLINNINKSKEELFEKINQFL